MNKNFLLYLKGMAMGAADVVPGVSGGTIAFITGIYPELLSTISELNPNALKTWKNQGFKAFWKEINGNFLLVLGAGILTSVFTLSKLINYLLHYHPIEVWSFFFGLIVASIFYIAKQIQKWNFTAFLGLILGTAIVVAISLLPPVPSTSNYLFLFVSGFLASTAMILPGISGSFILLILGSYSVVIAALSNLFADPSDSMLILGPLGLGIVTGLLLSSRALSYLLKNFENFMMSLLTGFLIGSLYKVWPWKETELIYDKATNSQMSFSDYTDGKYGSLTAYAKTVSPDQVHDIKVLTEANVSPQTYELINSGMTSNLMTAIIAALIGFSLLYILEYIAGKKHV